MERRSHSHRVVFSALAASLAVAFLAALYIHAHFARYQPRAVYHLPSRVEAVAWLNVEQNVGFDVFKEVVLPILEIGRHGPESRVLHLERKTTLELAVDTREFVFATLPRGRWLALAGGHFRQDGVLSGLVRMVKESGSDARLDQDLAVLTTGHALGISHDGVLVVSNSEEVAREAILEQDEGMEWKALLHKPGTMFNFLAYGPSTRFDGVPVFSGVARRFWLSVEPGNPFPVFVEGVGEDSAVSVVPPPQLTHGAWHKRAGPSGISMISGTVVSEDLRSFLRAWGREIQTQVWK